MEGWRQWQLGGDNIRDQQKTTRTHLTPTGFLMEGDYAQNAVCECNADFTTTGQKHAIGSRALIARAGGRGVHIPSRHVLTAVSCLENSMLTTSISAYSIPSCSHPVKPRTSLRS